MSEFGKNITRYRKDLGMTPRQLAEMCEIDKDRLKELENGKEDPTLAEVKALSDALRIRPERLLGWRRDGGPFITWWEEGGGERILHVEWEKPYKLIANESYPTDGAVRLIFEEVKE